MRDLKPFRNYLERAVADINKVDNISAVMTDHYSGSRQPSFANTLDNLRTEFKPLGEVISNILQSHTDYYSIGSYTCKCSVVGKSISFMSVIVSVSDLGDLARAFYNCSRPSLSRLQLSGITAYLEEKI